jgi:membrane-bound lytic murein transglycosylase B
MASRAALAMLTTAVVMVAVIAASIIPAAAAPDPAFPGPGPVEPPASIDINVPSIAAELQPLAVDSPEFRVARRAFDESAASREAAVAAQATAEQTIAELTSAITSLGAQIDKETARAKEVRAELSMLRASLAQIVVRHYVLGTNADMEPADLDAATERLKQKVLLETVDTSQRERAARDEHNLQDVVRQLRDHANQRQALRVQVQTAEQTRAQAVADQAQFDLALATQGPALVQAKGRATVVGADFSLLALDAYWRAAKETAVTKPKCGVEWWALAGITKVESRHGTFGGANLLGNGDTSARIVGIPLDGTNDTAVIVDTDDGTFDGDVDYDRAVGPMQFIPSTWKRWRADGNGDGTADPNNIYDAAEAAAHYLCASGPMRSDEDLLRGYFSYNHSDDYANEVLSFALAYRQLAIPPPAVASGG